MSSTDAAPQPTVLVDGLVMGESPRWFRDRWWCADWGARELLAIDPDTGRTEVVLRADSMPFSLDRTPDGDLLVVGDGRLVRIDRSGTHHVVADLTSISPHPWNEIVVDGRGVAHLNNIGFDMMGGDAPGEGFVARVEPDGRTAVVADGLAFPNGMALTPDDSTLIVAESYGNRLTAFDVEDGGLARRRVWAELGDGYPDGICLDAEGAAWYADVPNRRCVRVRQGGEVLQTIEVDRGCFSCTLGGPDRRTLGIVAANWGGPDAVADQAGTGRFLTVRVEVPGAGRP